MRRDMEMSGYIFTIKFSVARYMFLQIIRTKAPYAILQRGTVAIFHDSRHLNVFFME